ncbi:hypothetical protein E5676_scaffold455G001730 [Cucumis melo var. makuwa]|uniref:Uncharacterized protein n=1 Tax=Cucumis melo var. makuwa TaxID=1194695 RepID=A0A5D3E580_CUCMM|nr:hypothetical protein E5676_scaffold455G001730 [Cucumis melo var. makuwa]
MSNVYFHSNFSFQKAKYLHIEEDRPSTSTFDHLKMTNDQHQREMKILKAKRFHEENNDDKIYSRVSSSMKRKLYVDINQKLASSSSRNFIVASSSSSSKALNFTGASAASPPL